MVFSSPVFLFLFLPLVLATYYLVPKAGRNLALLFASWLFYLWGGGALLGLLLCSIAGNWLLGLLAWHTRSRSPAARRGAIGATLLLNLGVLGYFKYANFFVGEWNALMQSMGGMAMPWAEVILPIGISFYTFQSMSYVFDLARGNSQPLRNPLDFALYVSLFPQLIAGPIVRFHELEAQLKERAHSLHNLSAGACRFAIGLIKKVVIADSAGAVADQAFNLPPGQVSSATAWLGVLAYTVQIYFDFSGYSDMAIGLGRMFGFRFPENFRRPYSAYSITDFWRRWHITLSNWFRDYVYIPLGGSRHGRFRTGFNLLFVFLATGLWHGANWTFILWGLFHGFWLILERLTGWRHLDGAAHSHLWRVLRRISVLVIVMFGWALFRARNLDQALLFWERMLLWDGASLAPVIHSLLGPEFMICLIIGIGSFFLPGDWRASEQFQPGPKRRPALAFGLLLLCFPLALALALSSSFSPFLYFQF